MKKIGLFIALIATMILFSCGTATIEEADVVTNIPTPKTGDTIATITIENYGELKILLLTKEVPGATTDFIKMVEEGAYDNMVFHQSTEKFIAAGLSVDHTYTIPIVPVEYFGRPYSDEQVATAKHFSGAVTLINDIRSSLSWFNIVKTDPIKPALMDVYLEEGSNRLEYFTGDKETYENIGGLPTADGLNTVFGYVYEGMDIVEKIMSDVEVDPSSYFISEETPVVVTDVEISVY